MRKFCVQAGQNRFTTWAQVGVLMNSFFVRRRGVCETSQVMPGFYVAVSPAFPQPSGWFSHLLNSRLSPVSTGLTITTTNYLKI